MHSTKGFTLIELMIVVAIIAVLAAIAIPQYQGYVMRSQLSRIVGETGHMRTLVEECLNNGQLEIGPESCDVELVRSELIEGAYPEIVMTEESYRITSVVGGQSNTGMHGTTIEWRRTADGSWRCYIQPVGVLDGSIPRQCSVE